MIVYDLQCAAGHRFEGWFDDSRAFDEQSEKGLITCPVCNGSDVFKVPSTFGIGSGPKPQVPPPDAQVSPGDVVQMAHRLSEFIDKNFDNVGCDFAKEALKIHYGVTEPRNIRGVSTPDEEKTLKEEGISFFKLPDTSSKEDDAES